MSLPIFQTALKELSLMQTRWASQLNPVLQNPLNSIHILKNISLLSGKLNVVNHELGKNLQGWFPLRVRSEATLWDTQDQNQTPNLTLHLQTSSDVTIDLAVF